MKRGLSLTLDGRKSSSKEMSFCANGECVTTENSPARLPVWRRACLLLFLASLVPSSTMGAQQQTTQPTLRVLFIGNSYTYFNNLGDMVAGIAAAGTGPKIMPTLAVRGGQSLQWHLDNGPAMAALKTGTWDYVVLQEQSMLGVATLDGKPVIADSSAFHAAVREWARRVRGVGAKPILFMTWARRSALPDQAKLSVAYVSIGRELNIDVAPVGEAWSAALTRWLSLELHVFDESHPTPAGSYLAACVIFSTLTGRDPKGAPSVILGHPVSRSEGTVDFNEMVPLVDIGATTAGWLQEIAWKAVSNHRGRIAK